MICDIILEMLKLKPMILLIIYFIVQNESKVTRIMEKSNKLFNSMIGVMFCVFIISYSNTESDSMNNVLHSMIGVRLLTDCVMLMLFTPWSVYSDEKSEGMKCGARNFTMPQIISVIVTINSSQTLSG